jgi:hypothetical protein
MASVQRFDRYGNCIASPNGPREDLYGNRIGNQVARGADPIVYCHEHQMDRERECHVLHMTAEEAAAFDAEPFNQQMGRTYAESVAQVLKDLQELGEPVKWPELDLAAV